MIPPVLVRRVSRVLNRVPPDPGQVDELFDDVILLWRAFERTFVPGKSLAERARSTLELVVDRHGVAALPAVRAFADILRKFEGCKDPLLDAWFGEDPDSNGAGTWTAADRLDFRKLLINLAAAGAAPAFRWKARDTRDLSRVFYKVRNAVLHGSLETGIDLAPRVIGLLRQALIEVCIGRAAMLGDCSLVDARSKIEMAA